MEEFEAVAPTEADLEPRCAFNSTYGFSPYGLYLANLIMVRKHGFNQ